jgi:hypothetical protein
LLATVIEGSGDEWIRCTYLICITTHCGKSSSKLPLCARLVQFQLYDGDGDDVVNEVESKQILDSIVTIQKTVFTELFGSHVANLPKKHAKLLANGIEETNWKEKIPEKVRCVFHYAPKEDEADKTVHWESFKETQEKELPELNEMVRVYAKGIYDERCVLPYFNGLSMAELH